MNLKKLGTLLKLATVVTIGLVDVANAHDGRGRFGLDINEYCAQKLGAGWQQHLDSSLGAAGWSCIKGGYDGGKVGIDMTQACRMRYGQEYTAHNTDNTAAGWHCHKQ